MYQAGGSWRLSRRVRWIDHRPVAVTVGDLYFEVVMENGTVTWARVLRGARTRIAWWMNHLLTFTNAREVTNITNRVDN